jgi:shikimate dehydrogenase
MPRLAVLGHPVAHSRSPAMQNAALAALGLGQEWRYEAIDVAPEEFAERVRAMTGEGFAGANVTVPHKESALRLADVASEVANEIGAANTLVFADGRIQAHNTDAGGLIASLPGRPRARRALVLGAGGAARAAVWALSAEGAVVDVAGVDIWNRTPSRAELLYRDLSRFAELGGAPVHTPRQDIYGIIVNTTAVGLHGEDPFEHLPLERKGFDREQVVVDMVYGEEPSQLLAAAATAGAGVVDGIEILVQQGALSFEIWTDRKPPVDVMRAAAYSLGDR